MLHLLGIDHTRLDLPPQRHRPPADRRAWARDQGDPGIMTLSGQSSAVFRRMAYARSASMCKEGKGRGSLAGVHACPPPLTPPSSECVASRPSTPPPPLCKGGTFACASILPPLQRGGSGDAARRTSLGCREVRRVDAARRTSLGCPPRKGGCVKTFRAIMKAQAIGEVPDPCLT